MPQINAVISELLTQQAMLDEYHIPIRTQERMRADGSGPVYVRLGARRIAYRRSDIEAWLATKSFKHRADELTREVA